MGSSADIPRARKRSRLVPTSFKTVAQLRTAAALLAVTGGAAAVLAGATAAGLADLARGETLEQSIATGALFGTVGALVAGLVVFALFPLFQRLVGMREDVQLLHAASPMHPLLKRLMAEAPGTYMHSLAAANLAEAGAEAIGADPLLSRVGAYYHDIGKLLRPCFFFENQEGRNPHDIARPTISATIITAHVREGLELAEQYGLPQPVCDIVREHHGTTLVRYFYHRATQEDAGVYEADFRYQGGRPTSKEAALVMLADGSEAMVRALGDPTRASVERAVRTVIDERRADGQLDESGLTDEDLALLVTTFRRMLMSLYHLRCEYPTVIGATPATTANGDVSADQRAEPSRA